MSSSQPSAPCWLKQLQLRGGYLSFDTPRNVFRALRAVGSPLRGYRLGYGAGYYDLTLNGLRAEKTIKAVGLAFAAQEIGEVPVLSHDARLDLVLTEHEVIDCGE